MSITNDILDTAYFPDEYADILIDALTIAPGNFLSVKDALYHFRRLDDDQTESVMEHIAARIETSKPKE